MSTCIPYKVLLITCCLLWLFVQKSIQQCSGTTLSLVATNVRNQHQIASKNYPNDYDNNLRCGWLIDAGSNNERVVIDVLVWSLEETYDSVSFYDGDSRISLILSKHSGTSRSPFTIRSSGRYMYLYFYTDTSVTRPGFVLTYYSEYSVATSTPTPAPSTVITTIQSYTSSCGSSVTLGSVGGKYLSSPNWPYAYNNYLSCWLYISTDSSSLSVKLTVYTIHTQVNRDTVYIYDGSNSDYQLAALSGTPSVPLTYYSSGQYMSVLFVTDASTVYSGFTMVAETVAASIPSCVSGLPSPSFLNVGTATDYFQSPNYPSNYGNNYLEYWLITKTDETQTLIFNIIDFRLEWQSTCNYDSLKIYYGACEASGVLYTLCDHKTGYYTHTYGKYALVKFSTDSSVVRRGFKFSVYLGEYRGNADISTEKSTYDNSENSAIAAAIMIPIVIITVCVIAIVCKIRASRNRPTVSTPKTTAGITMTLKEKVDKTPSGRRKKNVVTPHQQPAQPPLQHQIWTQPTPYPPPSAPPMHQYSDPAYPPTQSAYMPNYNTQYTSTPQETSVPNPFEYKPYAYS